MQIQEVNYIRTIQYYKDCGWGDRAEAFRDWMVKVDARCLRVCGMSIHDLPDWDFASAFDAGEDPEDVADEVMEDSGFEA